MTCEIWRSCYDGRYSVSDWGRIRRDLAAPGARVGRILRQHSVGKGYPGVMLSIGGSHQVMRSVHSLVAEAFIGPRPTGYHVNHRDGNKTNNRPSNLEYVTPTENSRHAARLGLLGRHHPLGELNPQSRLTEPAVQSIRADFRRGREIKRLAEEHGVHISTVKRVVAGHSWRHVA